MFSDNISKSDSVINSKKYFSPFVEPEFSFKMKNELNILEAPFNADKVYKSISAVLPSIEIVDSRYKDWTTIGVKNLIADNAVHAHWVFGEEIDIRGGKVDSPEAKKSNLAPKGPGSTR